MTHFDYICIGGGSGGIASANRAAKHGKKAAIIEAKDIGNIFDGYIYYTTSYDEKGSPRKIKSFFKNAFAPEDTESRVQEVFTSFKVYTFKYRSDPNLGKPSDWDILDVDKIGWLGDLMEMNVSYNDAFDASF